MENNVMWNCSIKINKLIPFTGIFNKYFYFVGVFEWRFGIQQYEFRSGKILDKNQNLWNWVEQMHSTMKQSSSQDKEKENIRQSDTFPLWGETIMPNH